MADLARSTITTDGADGFGIAVYGVGSYTSYMYPGGLDVKQINVRRGDAGGYSSSRGPSASWYRWRYDATTGRGSSLR